MSNPKIRLEVCAFFVDEFRAALAAEERDDVEIVPIHGACDERRHPSRAESPQNDTPTLRLMGVCSGGAACPKTLHSCFELLLGPDKVEALLNDGAHLLTPAMVRAYPETLQSLNEKPENLHAYFAESVRAWVVVDAGVTSLTAAEQTAFLSATGGTMELLPTELHLLRANLRAALAQGVVANDNHSDEQIATLQHRLADYTMAYDLISRLIPYQGERTIVDAILELFYMLCAPRAVHLLLIPDGGENIAEGSVQIFSQPADSGNKDQLRIFLHCAAPWGEIEFPHGFYFQVHQGDAQILGAVVVEGTFLPEHQRNYLDIAHLLMPILRLALHNARSYERLCNTERELRASQVELEQRVEERTAQLTAEITVRKQSEQALREAEARFRSSFESAAIGMALVSIEGRFVDANSALCQLIGYTHDELTQKTFLEITYPDDIDVDMDYARQLAEGKRASYQMEKRYFHKNGNIVWVLLTGSAVRDAQENLLYFIAQIQDITERKRTEQELRIAATAFEAREGITVTDAQGTILRVNSAFTNITGYSAAEAVGKNLRLLKSGRHDADFYASMWESIRDTGTWEGEIWNRRKNGEVYPERLSITAVKSADGTATNYVGTFNDITLSKAAADEIKNLAFYDPLTRLPNRRLLRDRLQQALASSARSGRAGALLFIDLDNFKTLNDTLGHDMGDLLLQQVAQRLETCVREGDTVARLGGDEFVVMLEDLSKNSLEAAEQTTSVGNKILATLNQPYLLALHEYHNSPSIGATLFNDHIQTMDELLKQADISMYQAKKAGRNTLRFFDPQMQEAINARADLESELHTALEKHQFRLYYQIQVDGVMADGTHRPLGAEALIRWQHPERGLVPPAQFIPLAEETGLILPIGQWVLETACTQLNVWQRNALTRDLALAVNVSARQFRQPDFVDQVQAVVQRHAINPKLLKLELTESLLLEDIEDTITTMNALSKIGVQFSLDDFGTGYSSLQYLKRLPLDQLKIDQSFIRDIALDESDRAIVHTIIAMADSLKLSVIAEGVETDEQLQFLLNTNCIHYQGYLFGRPVPIDQFETLLKQC